VTRSTSLTSAAKNTEGVQPNLPKHANNCVLFVYCSTTTRIRYRNLKCATYF